MKNFAKTKTRLKFYNELVKDLSEKFLRIFCQRKITDDKSNVLLSLFIINQITKTLKANITVKVQPLLKYSS